MKEETKIQNSPLIWIGLITAVLMFSGPSNAPLNSEDSLSKADEAYREELAVVILKMKDEERTKATADQFAEELSSARMKTHAAPTQEIFALWWNGEAEEAAVRIRERKLGEKEVVPIDYDQEEDNE